MIYYRAKIDFICGHRPLIEDELLTEKEAIRYGAVNDDLVLEKAYSKFLQKIEANPKDTYTIFGVRKLTKQYRYKVVK